MNLADPAGILAGPCRSQRHQYMLRQAIERIKAVSDNTLDLDQTETKLLLTDTVSDEALEAAAEMDQKLGAITLGSPIWCPDPSGGPRREISGIG
jgi:hypothetical protein